MASLSRTIEYGSLGFYVFLALTLAPHCPAVFLLSFIGIWLFRLDQSGCPTCRTLFETSVLSLVSNKSIFLHSSMDDHQRMLVGAAAICIQQLLVAYFIILMVYEPHLRHEQQRGKHESLGGLYPCDVYHKEDNEL